MRKKKKFEIFDTSDENLINLTPLIDVVFVVLISFIIIAPLLEVDHINLANSSTKSDTNIPKTNIVIKVKEDNSIWFNNKIVTLKELDFILREKKSFKTTQNPQLIHDKKASFGTYQSIKNLAEANGFEEIDLILKPE